VAALKVLCWSEESEPREVYPAGVNGAVAEALSKLRGMDVRVAGQGDADQGLSDAGLAWADVVVWFGHVHQEAVRDDLVDRVIARVHDGLGLVALHSSHISKPFKALMGTSGWHAGWHEDAGPEMILFWQPDHPVADGMRPFAIPQTEIYIEPFDIAPPDAVVFVGLWQEGRWFRSGCAWARGQGRLFYFRPGHETYPIYFQDEVRALLANAVEWAGRRR
jgi:trehalose utilization protein